MVLISSAKLSNWSRVVLISFSEIFCHLIPKKYAFLPILHCKTLKKCSNFSGALRAPIFLPKIRFSRFCTVKHSKNAQFFLARFARQFFSGRCFLFHQPDLQICQGGSYFICQILKLSLGGSYLGGGFLIAIPRYSRKNM